MDNEQVNTSNTVDISPIKKTRRLLSFFGDFFITFILSFVLFNVVVMPLGNLAAKSKEREARNNEAAITQYEILYEQNILHYELSTDKYYYSSNVETTLNCWLSYYAFDDENPIPTHPVLGHRAENEVFYHFYADIRGSYATYKAILEHFNNQLHYFDIDGENISFVPDVKQNIYLAFFSPTDMSEAGKLYLSYLQNFFINVFADVFTNINNYDLVSLGRSYLTYKNIVNQCEKDFQTLIIVSSFIAYFLSCLICYFIIPLFNKDNKTISMMIMRTVRIGTNNLYLLNKNESILSLIYSLVFNLPMLILMPMAQVSFTYVFNIVPLTSCLFIGVILWLTSLVITIVSPLGRSLSDVLTRSVLISDEDLDAIYRSKGYNV